MRISEIFSVATAVLVLAGVSVAIVRGDQTAKVLTATANGFANVIRSATLQGA